MKIIFVKPLASNKSPVQKDWYRNKIIPRGLNRGNIMVFVPNGVIMFMVIAVGVKLTNGFTSS